MIPRKHRKYRKKFPHSTQKASTRRRRKLVSQRRVGEYAKNYLKEPRGCSPFFSILTTGVVFRGRGEASGSTSGYGTEARARKGYELRVALFRGVKTTRRANSQRNISSLEESFRRDTARYEVSLVSGPQRRKTAIFPAQLKKTYSAYSTNNWRQCSIAILTALSPSTLFDALRMSITNVDYSRNFYE